jgi:hypothetical protein
MTSAGAQILRYASEVLYDSENSIFRGAIDTIHGGVLINMGGE